MEASKALTIGRVVRFSHPLHMGILIGILTFVLILISLFMVLVVLAQKAKDGGVGAAMGGGAAEAAFGAETGNVLSGATIKASIAFFVLSFVLYLGHIYQRKHAAASGSALPSISTSAPAVPAGTSAAPEAVLPTPASVPAPGATTPEQPKTNP